MRKFIRFILILFIVLVACLVILNIFEPNNITVTCSILIKAPKEVVFEQMVKFKNWPNWSPFYEMDTTAQYTYHDTDSKEGSGFRWDSKKKDVGSGSMSNSIVSGTHLDYSADIWKPYKSIATGYLEASDSAGMTKATWSVSAHIGFPMNALQIFPFMDVRKTLGSMFDHGLEKMKKYVESHPTELFTDVEIKEVDYPAHIFLGLHKNIGWNEIMSFCGQTYDIIKMKDSARINGHATGIYYTWDTTWKTTEMLAAYPVSDTLRHRKDSLIYVHVDSVKTYMAQLKGGYGKEGHFHRALGKYMEAKGIKPQTVIEEYVAGPKNEPDSNMWITNIYYLLK